MQIYELLVHEIYWGIALLISISTMEELGQRSLLAFFIKLKETEDNLHGGNLNYMLISLTQAMSSIHI